MKELSEFHCYGNRFQLVVQSPRVSPGDEDSCQGRQSTETLVALIKSKRRASFNLIKLRVWGALCVVPELFS